MTINEYLDLIKERLVTDLGVSNFQVTRERSTLLDGYIRAKLNLTDGSQLEFSEYVQRSPKGEIEVMTYGYHWAEADNRLIKRWDNAPIFLICPDSRITFTMVLPAT